MALSSHALTTLDAVKSELGILSTAEDDAYLERKINAASDDIERYCGRHFERGTVTSEPIQANGQLVLLLDRTPLITLTSISYVGSVVDPSLYEVFDAEAGMVKMLFGAYDASGIARNIAGDPLPGTARKLYAATYVGGYILPKDENGAALPTPIVRTLPYDLEEACVTMVVGAYRKRGRDRTIQSESILSYSVTYAGGVAGVPAVPPEVQRVLDRYKRWSV